MQKPRQTNPAGLFLSVHRKKHPCPGTLSWDFPCGCFVAVSVLDHPVCGCFVAVSVILQIPVYCHYLRLNPAFCA
jgi:hypothetical protein